MNLLTAPFRLAAWLLAGTFGFLTTYPRRIIGGVLAALLVVGIFSTLQGIPVISVQRGFRGTGMIEFYNPRVAALDAANNRQLEALPPVKPSGVSSAVAYRNIRVLRDVDSAEFLRLMGTLPGWIAPATGCAFCHSTVNPAEDLLYTKQVARRMIEMTRFINTNYKSHVGATGVTCNTCHRGRAVPTNIWFVTPMPSHGVAETTTGYSGLSHAGAQTSLQQDPFTPLLMRAETVRVIGKTALPSGNRQSIKQTDQTYSLMAHFAQSLGVGCTYCHNTRDFSSWDQGTPARVTAWHGIEMTRALNNDYMVPLTSTFPRASLGPLGDVAKINCATCHQGAYKPLYGASNLAAYPELIGPAENRQASVAAPDGARP